jgi:hypothetical protein
LVVQKALISCSPTCWFFVLVAKWIEFYWGSHCLCLLFLVYFLLFTVQALRFQVLY